MNTYRFQGGARAHKPLYFSPSQYLRLNDFNFPHRFEHFHSFIRKASEGAKKTVFTLTLISAAALIKFFTLQVRRLFECGICFKVGRDKEM